MRKKLDVMQVRMIWLTTVVIAGRIMCGQAWNSSPSFDEPAHLATGLVALRTFDPGYFKVNPPLHKLTGAIAVDTIYELQLPLLLYSSSFSNSFRPEFKLAQLPQLDF